MQEVAVGVLTEARRVFIGQRRATARYGGMWEFPGGKIERGESPVGALSRELREELGIEIAEPRYLGTVEHRYDDGGTFRVWYYRVEQWHGAFNIDLWERVAWVSIEELPSYALFEANRAILPALAASFESDDERFMRIALAEAERAARSGEVPVGCVITLGGTIIARSHNRQRGIPRCNSARRAAGNSAGACAPPISMARWGDALRDARAVSDVRRSDCPCSYRACGIRRT